MYKISILSTSGRSTSYLLQWFKCECLYFINLLKCWLDYELASYEENQVNYSTLYPALELTGLGVSVWLTKDQLLAFLVITAWSWKGLFQVMKLSCNKEDTHTIDCSISGDNYYLLQVCLYCLIFLMMRNITLKTRVGLEGAGVLVKFRKQKILKKLWFFFFKEYLPSNN